MVEKDKRNYGIDIARILAMLMVVFLHNLLEGGILRVDNTSFTNMTYWLIENIMIIAVNIFAMISGFLIMDRRINPFKILKLWKVVFFWSVIPTITLMMILGHIDVVSLVKSCFPVLFKQYWYFNAYVLLFIFIPFLNEGIRILSLQHLRIIVFVLLILSASAGFLGNMFLEGGYSALWLIIMYLTGAVIKKEGLSEGKIDSKWLILTFVVCILLSLLGEYLSINYLGHPLAWIRYTSPIVILESISLFILLLRIKVSRPSIKKLLIRVSPLTFAVYLADSNPFFFSNILHSSLSFLNRLDTWVGLSYLVVLSVGIFLIVILLELVRQQLFQKVRNAIRPYSKNGMD